MATKMANVEGSYSEKVTDDKGGQAAAKFGTPIVKPKMAAKEPQQSITKPKYSSDSKAHSIP